MSDHNQSNHENLPACGTSTEVVELGRNQFPENTKLNDSICQELIKTAMNMRKRSYVPYSKFRVGAALLTKENKIYTGCNIESATYTPTNCAERTAFFKAISEGETEFSAIAVVGGAGKDIKDYCPPCGVCRQVMMEFCHPQQFFIILARNEEDYWIYTLDELLPMGFSPKNLEK